MHPSGWYEQFTAQLGTSPRRYQAAFERVLAAEHPQPLASQSDLALALAYQQAGAG